MAEVAEVSFDVFSGAPDFTRSTATPHGSGEISIIDVLNREHVTQVLVMADAWISLL